MKIKMITKHLLLIILSSICLNTFGQNFEWAKKAGGGALDYGNAICTDLAGNVYVTGEFELTAYFNGTPLTTAGLHDIFVAKYDPAGALLWVKRAGGPGGDGGHGISLDASGNVYVTGEFEGVADFDNVILTANIGVNEIFIAKYSASGDVLWAKQAGGTNKDKGLAISADAVGNSYITGWFNTWAYFGSTTLVSVGEADIFVAKYNTDGDFKWVQQGSDSAEAEGKGISADKYGNVYVAGYFNEKVTFGSSTITSAGSRDIFLAKFDTSGNLQWLKQAGGSSGDVARALATDPSGNVYITGDFRGNCSFGSITLNNFGSSDAFLACYDPAGDIVWAKQGGGNDWDGGKGIGIDIFSQIYISGEFEGTATFGNTTLTCTDTATSDMFVAGYDKNGNFLWAKKAGGDTLDRGNAVSPDNYGNVYVTGFFGHTLYFGSFALANSGNHSDIFLAKYSADVVSEPTGPSANLSLVVNGCNEIEASWVKGNGEGRILVAKAGSPVDVLPVDGNGYIADDVWANGSDIGSGNYVVYGDTGNNVTVSVLPGQTYHFAVFEYNGSGFSSNYLTANYPLNNATTNSFSISASPTSGSICPGETINLSASGATTYSWSPSNGLSNATIANPIASPAITTTYIVTGTTNDCWNKATVAITVTCTGIEEKNKFNDLVVFPNPGQGIFKIKYSSQKRDFVKLKIINFLGEIVYVNQFETNNGKYSKSIDLTHLSDGIYLLQLESTDNIISNKILIQK